MPGPTRYTSVPRRPHISPRLEHSTPFVAACSVFPDSCAKKCEGKQVCLENVVDPDKLREMFQKYTGEARREAMNCVLGLVAFVLGFG